jgi:hypothetical protein
MLTLVRRSRAMALAMVLLAPGITGSAVQWLHACPAGAEAEASDHQNHDPAPAQSGHSQGCECIDSCNTIGAGSPVRAVTIGAAVILPVQRATLPIDPDFVPVGLPSDLLPPSTAPPLA